MDIYVLNQSLEIIGVIDTYISVIWTTRYYALGDFELETSADGKSIGLLQTGNFLVREKDIGENGVKRNVMIIQNVELQSDPENGSIYRVSGKSLAGLLSQRVIARQSTLIGGLRDVLYLLVAENAAFPSMSARQIPNFVLAPVPVINQTVSIQVTGDNLADFLSVTCEKYGIGFDVYIQDNKFIFKLYTGIDRSTDQNTNSHVVFSDEFDNLINSTYQYSGEDYKNAAIVAGEGEGAGKIIQNVGVVSGLNRHELYVDAGSVSTNEGNIDSTNYNTLLTAKGTEALTEYQGNELFDGEADVTTQYVYGKDFFCGDLVQIENNFGISAKVRITEVIESIDQNGTRTIPTFTNLNA